MVKVRAGTRIQIQVRLNILNFEHFSAKGNVTRRTQVQSKSKAHQPNNNECSDSSSNHKSKEYLKSPFIDGVHRKDVRDATTRNRNTLTTIIKTNNMYATI